MPAFLAKFGAWLGGLLLDKLLGKAIELIKGYIAKRDAAKKAKADADKSVEPLQKAKTADEIDKSTDDALNGI